MFPQMFRASQGMMNPKNALIQGDWEWARLRAIEIGKEVYPVYELAGTAALGSAILWRTDLAHFRKKISVFDLCDSEIYQWDHHTIHGSWWYCSLRTPLYIQKTLYVGFLIQL